MPSNPSTAHSLRPELFLQDPHHQTNILLRTILSDLHNLKHDIATLDDKMTSTNRKLARLETAAVETTQELHHVPARLVDVFHRQVDDVRRDVKRIKATADETHAVVRVVWQNVKQSKATADETNAMLRDAEKVSATKGDVEDARDCVQGRVDMYYTKNTERVQALQRSVMDLAHPPDPHRRIVEHVVARLEPKLPELMGTRVKEEFTSTSGAVEVVSPLGFKRAKPVGA